MAGDPTDEELLAFADSLLVNLGEQLRAPSVLAEAVRVNRDLWLLLYHTSHEFDESEG